MSNTNGLTSRELIRFSDLLVKSNQMQLYFLKKQIDTEILRRLQQQKQDIEDSIDDELEEKIHGGNGY